MKTTPAQLAILAVAGFGSLILLQVLAQYRSSESFRNYMENLKAENLIPELRRRVVAEENMEAPQEVYHPSAVAIVNDFTGGEDDGNN